MITLDEFAHALDIIPRDGASAPNPNQSELNNKIYKQLLSAVESFAVRCCSIFASRLAATNEGDEFYF